MIMTFLSEYHKEEKDAYNIRLTPYGNESADFFIQKYGYYKSSVSYEAGGGWFFGESLSLDTYDEKILENQLTRRMSNYFQF